MGGLLGSKAPENHLGFGPDGSGTLRLAQQYLDGPWLVQEPRAVVGGGSPVNQKAYFCPIPVSRLSDPVVP